MRRLALLFAVFLLGALAAGAASASANTDWAVNGTPLVPGQEVAVKFASVTPIQLLVPEMGIEVTCASWKAKGTLVGGETGTGELVKPKFGHCTKNEGGSLVDVKVHITNITLHTDLAPPAGQPPTTELVFELCFAKGRCEPATGMKGTLDSLGPNPGEGNLLDFPQPALPATNLTYGGAAAEVLGKAAFKLPRHAMLSQAEL